MEIQEKMNLQNKKIIIYGHNRFARDFSYIFDYIDISYYVDDVISEGVAGLEQIKKENFADILVIICKYDYISAAENLEELGLKYKENYFVAEDFFKELDYPFEERSKGKKIFVWGTGNCAHAFFHDWIEKRHITVWGCVDNDAQKVGRRFFGHEVYSPEKILKAKNVFVIVASTYYEEIKVKALQYGLRENIDFVSYEKLNTDCSNRLKATIYDVPKMKYFCQRPFEYAAVRKDGTVGLCTALHNGEKMSMYECDFGDIWKSDQNKISRLSIINGTYTFCDVTRCPHLREKALIAKDFSDIHYYYSVNYTEEYVDEKCLVAQKIDRDSVLICDGYVKQELDYPKEMMISIDSTCNLNCITCRKNRVIASKQEQEKKQEVSVKLQEKVIPHIEKIRLAGDGEVCFSRIYRDLLRSECVKNRKELGILTNATLFTPNNWEIIKGNHDIIKIVCSVDSAVKETYEKIRRGADFEALMKNLKFISELRKKGKVAEFAIHCVVQRLNYREMPQYVQLGIDLGCDKIEFVGVVNYGVYTSEEYKNVTMFDEDNKMKPELAEVLKNPIFNDERVNLFEWREW